MSFDHLAAPCGKNGCSDDPKVRKLFGCDDTAEHGYQVWCWACRGSAGGCPVCDHGRVTLTRCPNYHDGPEVHAMLKAFGHYRSGFLPVAGGTQDQSATFVDSMSFIQAVVSQHEEIEMDKARGK